VLYLAEVQKQRGGLLSGNSKTELKLLACQKGDQNWSTVSEDIIAAEEASKLNDGALVLVELSPSRQVQRIQEAGRPLVNILQNFSRQLEKFKLKEDEIDQWKQSLTFQAQELNRREMDMEARLEQLQEQEDELQELASQKQEFIVSRAEIDRLQAEVERNRQELEGAWEHLRGEQIRLEELKNPSLGIALDPEHSKSLSILFDRLSNSLLSTNALREKCHVARESVERQQNVLNPHWQQFHTQRSIADHQLAEVESLSHTIHERQIELQQLDETSKQQTLRLQANNAGLESKQAIVSELKKGLNKQEEIYQLIHELASNADNVVIGQQVDIADLQQMPLDELKITVGDLQEKLDKDSVFVQEQEQELKYKLQTIQNLQAKLQNLSGEAQESVAIELNDEQDLYQMLDESLIGQRRSLLERQKAIKQYQAVLLQRQGDANANAIIENPLNLNPILSQIESHRQQQSQEIQKLEREIGQINYGIEMEREIQQRQALDLAQKRQDLKVMEDNLISLRIENAELWGRVHLYEEALQQIQDGLDALRLVVHEMGDSLQKLQESGDRQLQTLNQMRQTVPGLISDVE
jgi:chromosome segregation ATPase